LFYIPAIIVLALIWKLQSGRKRRESVRAPQTAPSG
jgi:hypothetical protein